MSDLNLENIVGFKAVDKDGNEQNVTVDEMVDMVSTRMVMALSETSTFVAAAATGNDVYENELPTVTDAANVRVLQSSGDAAKMTMQSLASNLGELIGIATSNKSGLMSPKLYCAIPNSYVVNGATELKGKYVKIISVNDWSGSIINVKVSNYGNGSYFYIILCLATNNIGRWASGKLIAGNISGFSFYRVDKSIYMFIPDSIQDLYVTLDASMGNVSYGEEYENTIDLSNPITIS
jgi:hypothetical protein|nr:MAG TPA: hypothetical protein [Bacteriophage sp.]